VARHEQDREDLLREATALVERVELEVEGFSAPVVIGFRRSGEGSVYFGADPVYQFNRAGELRRGYRAGRLLKAEQGRLVFLDRRRSPNEVVLAREVVTGATATELLAEAQERLDRLLDQLSGGRFRVVGQVSPAGDVVAHARDWLRTLPRPLPVATVPNVASAGE